MSRYGQNRRRHALVAALLAIAVAPAGCALFRPSPAPGAPPADALPPSDAALRVALLWADPVDLDLYVTDPALETVYFANNPSGGGGRLERDVECDGVSGPGGSGNVEVIRWQAPPSGGYRVGVDFIDDCGSRLEEVSFRVVVDVGGERREESRRIRLERFEPVVLEFDVPGASGGQSRSQPAEEAK